MKTYPCPHNRPLTDPELDRIFNVGWAQWKRAEDQERRRRRLEDGDSPYNDPDWWKK